MSFLANYDLQVFKLKIILNTCYVLGGLLLIEKV